MTMEPPICGVTQFFPETEEPEEFLTRTCNFSQVEQGLQALQFCCCMA